jgi:hypothetical protein
LETFDFTLILDLDDEDWSDPMYEALYGAGADDATIGRSNGVDFASFTREADDLLDAVVSAIETIEGAGVGVRVTRVEPDDLVSIADIARRTGRTRESIRLLILGDRGPGGFPAPTARLGSGRSRVWWWADVAEWFKSYEMRLGASEVEPYLSTISAVNDFLRMRTFLTRSDPTTIRARDLLERRLGGDLSLVCGSVAAARLG